MSWINISRIGSIYEEEMWVDGTCRFRHRLRPFMMDRDMERGRAIPDWTPGKAPDNIGKTAERA